MLVVPSLEMLRVLGKGGVAQRPLGEAVEGPDVLLGESDASGPDLLSGSLGQRADGDGFGSEAMDGSGDPSVGELGGLAAASARRADEEICISSGPPDFSRLRRLL